MDRDNVWFLTKQFRKLFDKYFGPNDSPNYYDYIVDFDPADRSNFDFIIYRNYRRGYFKLNTSLSFKETCEMLVFYGNIIPLWIKVNLIEDTKTIQLTISKRFRKKHVIAEWHRDDELMPIIYSISEI